MQPFMCKDDHAGVLVLSYRWKIARNCESSYLNVYVTSEGERRKSDLEDGNEILG